MESFILGFSGRKGSGKTTLAREVSMLLRWAHVGFGSYVRFLAVQKGLPDTTENLQELGQSMIEEDSMKFCQDLLSFSKIASTQPFIVEGIRHLVVLYALREIVFPRKVLLIYVHAPEKLITERLSKRSNFSREQLLGLEQHATEIEVQTEIKKCADLIIDGSKPIVVNAEYIVDWIAKRHAVGYKNI